MVTVGENVIVVKIQDDYVIVIDDNVRLLIMDFQDTAKIFHLEMSYYVVHSKVNFNDNDVIIDHGKVIRFDNLLNSKVVMIHMNNHVNNLSNSNLMHI